MARSAAAIVHGYRTFDPEIDVAGVIFNRVGSDTHEALLREALEPLGIPVVGALRRDDRVTAPERHLGLVPAGEREGRTHEALATLAAATERYVDLDGVLALARAAPAAPGPAWSPEPAHDPTSPAARDHSDRAGHRSAPAPPVNGTGRPRNASAPTRIAIARGPAFSFHYEENLELLRAAGAELVPLDPLRDETLPEGTGALVLAGGFPEVFGAELEANAPLRGEVAAFAATGRPVLAECGGLLYLARELDGHAMCGAIPAVARMAGRMTLGYREATALTATPWMDAGEQVRGHEFHYSAVEVDAGAPPAWRLAARGIEREGGVAVGGVQAGYLHVHWAAHPELAARFVRAAAAKAAVAA
jgi:cobyrinic acid a,c-diamide synthase